MAGDRGALWWQFHRLITEGHPTWVIGENVAGLLSSRDGQDFATIIDSLTECGYGVAWGVLDAQYFGVAQRRRRVFIVGHSGGVPRPEVLALSEGMFGHPEPRRETGGVVAGTLETRTTTSRYRAEPGHIVYRQQRSTDYVEDRIASPSAVRRLTPLECQRLQGFPDDFYDGIEMSDTQKYRQMGNAVAVPVVEWIMRRIEKEER